MLETLLQFQPACEAVMSCALEEPHMFLNSSRAKQFIQFALLATFPTPGFSVKSEDDLSRFGSLGFPFGGLSLMICCLARPLNCQSPSSWRMSSPRWLVVFVLMKITANGSKMQQKNLTAECGSRLEWTLPCCCFVFWYQCIAGVSVPGPSRQIHVQAPPKLSNGSQTKEISFKECHFMWPFSLPIGLFPIQLPFPLPVPPSWHTTRIQTSAWKPF